MWPDQSPAQPRMLLGSERFWTLAARPMEALPKPGLLGVGCCPLATAVLRISRKATGAWGPVDGGLGGDSHPWNPPGPGPPRAPPVAPRAWVCHDVLEAAISPTPAAPHLGLYDSRGMSGTFCFGGGGDAGVGQGLRQGALRSSSAGRETPLAWSTDWPGGHGSLEPSVSVWGRAG